MGMTTIGDLAQHFATRRQNTDIKSRMNTLSEELSSGKVRDVTRHLSGDTARIASADNDLRRIASFQMANTETAHHLAAVQTVLAEVETMRGDLSSSAMMITESSSPDDVESVSSSAKQTLNSLIQSLNTRFAGRSLFAGSATNVPALSDADTIISAVAGVAQMSSDPIAAIDAWFDDPAGFLAIGYMGDTGDFQTRRLGTDRAISNPARADNDAIRATVKAVVTAAIASEIGLSPDDQIAMMTAASEQLFAASDGIARLQGEVGLAEQTVEDQSARLTAQKAAITLMQSSLTDADPFETATNLQQVQLQLETHYTLTARLAGLSFTGYMR